MNTVRNLAPLLAVVMLAVFLMPPALCVLSPLDSSATLPEDMDATPDVVLISVPIALMRWQPQAALMSVLPALHFHPQMAKVDLFQLDCRLLC